MKNLDENIINLHGEKGKQWLANLPLSKQRIIDWCYVQTVLAWAWTLEDNGDETYFKKLTELFNRHS